MNPKSVDDMSGIEIYEFGLKAISLKLGPVGVVRFVHLFDDNAGTYALDQLKLPNTNKKRPIKNTPLSGGTWDVVHV